MGWCSEKPFLLESQDEAACGKGWLVDEMAVKDPMGLTLLLCQGP